jgi:hypothetical protein
MMSVKTRLSRLSLLALALALAGALSPAQPRVGEFVLSATGTKAGLHYTSTVPPFQFVKTLTGGALSCVRLAPDSTSLYCGMADFPHCILKVGASGSVSTLATLPDGYAPTGIEFDQDGSCLIAADGSMNTAIFRLSGSYLSTWVTAGGTWNGIARDLDTGDFVVGEHGAGRLLRIDRLTRKVTTVASGLGLGSVTGVACIPETGCFAVSRRGTSYGLAIVDRKGRIARQVAIRDAEGVCVNETTGNLHVVAYGVILTTSSHGDVISTRNHTGFGFTGVEVYGNRALFLNGSGAVGREQTVSLRFEKSKNATYLCALSFGIRPGIALSGGRTLSLAPDPIFFLTLGRNIPGVTRDFLGMTNRSTGGALARFTLPKSFPVGTCIYVAAAALNAAEPDGLDITNTGVVKTYGVIPR